MCANGWMSGGCMDRGGLETNGDWTGLVWVLTWALVEERTFNWCSWYLWKVIQSLILTSLNFTNTLLSQITNTFLLHFRYNRGPLWRLLGVVHSAFNHRQDLSCTGTNNGRLSLPWGKWKSTHRVANCEQTPIRNRREGVNSCVDYVRQLDRTTVIDRRMC